MALQKDSQGNIIELLDRLNGIALIDNRVNTSNLGALNAETVVYCMNTNAISIYVRGTFSLTLVCEYSLDGTNYIDAGIFTPLTELYVPGITAAGSYVVNLPIGVKQVRVRCSVYTSGSATVAMRGSQGMNFIYAKQIPSTQHVTITAASGAAATATLPSAGTGLFHYITRIEIQRIAAAALTAGAAPTVITTTNLPGSRAFSVPADAAAQGVIYDKVVEMNNPIKSSAAATATTIVAPVTTGVIWRISVDYYIGK